MKKYYWINVPNIITFLRIIGTFALIFIKTFSLAFYILYSLCGISDVLDGYIARKTNTQSTFGAKLDSVADLSFYFVMIIKVLPDIVIQMSIGAWIVIGIIVLLRVASYILAGVKYHSFSSVHSILNKLCGFCVFTIPYVILLPFRKSALYTIIIIAVFAALDELIQHMKNNKQKTNTKSFLQLLQDKIPKDI